ncbi:uncharacterized protein DSM5745_10730 [Aspergillus mulundensis]|uniref:Tubby C-terminal domain-containing protein n=1 Tax=Aspergillus mulundensis TaxID=1810919 RepID=A0A3D8QHC8_9EURO|nr:Uncharacterized protein DSM5745_10730 [Aspergillus mulundensis]RDW61232.1 Uncharacterized protein DSM5745_10730 [Aspergillus mulundensis]
MTNPFGHADVKLRDPPSRGSDSADTQSVDLAHSRVYHIYHTPIRYDYRVSDVNKNHLYYVYNSHLKPLKADITLHAGENSKEPVAGVCKFLHLSRHCKVGLGDPQHAGAMIWEDLQCQNLALSKYRWPMSVPMADGRLERRWFVWKRTHSVGADGESPLLFSLRNYKLIDEQNGKVVAVFTSNSFKSVRKNGKLQVAVGYGPEFDLMALITLLAMYEKVRRRWAKGGGGGGDGG